LQTLQAVKSKPVVDEFLLYYCDNTVFHAVS